MTLRTRSRFHELAAAAPADLRRAGLGQGFINVLDHQHRAVGLFGHLLPLFKAKTGIDIRAWWHRARDGRSTRPESGDADVVFVHDKVAEAKFVEEGFGADRPRDVQRLRARRPEEQTRREGGSRQG